MIAYRRVYTVFYIYKYRSILFSYLQIKRALVVWDNTEKVHNSFQGLQLLRYGRYRLKAI